MRYSFVSLTGPYRRENQDALLLERVGPNFFSLVCDGMGGHWGGGFASEIATRIFKEIIKIDYVNTLSKKPVLDDEVYALSIIRNAIKKILKEMRNFAGNNEERLRMGTTFSLLILNPTIDKGMLVNIGDSRCYSFNKAQNLSQLLPDQNLYNYLVKLNYTSKQIEEESYRNLRALTSCLGPTFGTQKNLDIDYRFFWLKDIDYLLQASDGLYDFLSPEELKEVIISDANVKLKLEQMIQRALKNSSNDNISGVLIKL